jgi:hypothetical protein
MRALLLTIVSLSCAACSEVILSEERAQVCGNGADDDGDGLTDCEDPSCDASGVCETSEIGCTNGVDDDGDALADCAEETCRTAGFCDSFEAECDVLLQEGCPVGMGCYRTADGTTGTGTRCRSAGNGQAGSSCSLSEIDDLGDADPHPCSAGLGCIAVEDVGSCGAFCDDDTDCPTGAICEGSDGMGSLGACAEPCDPRVLAGCATDLACISYHELGEAFASGGARWACRDEALARGIADVGDPCEDPPAGLTPAAQVCRSSTACVPDSTLGGAFCREVCDTRAPLCSSGSCTVLYPGDPVVSGVGDKVFGVCL